MKQLFLASEIDVVAKKIANDIGLKKVKRSKTAFIYTAAEKGKLSRPWFKNNRKGLVKAGFNLIDYTITGKTANQIEKDLKDADIIHVNGGNTSYLLFQSRKSGFDKYIKKAVANGKIYTSSSAGSIIAGPNISPLKWIDKINYKKELKDLKGYNLVNFTVLPHWTRKDWQKGYSSKNIKHALKSKQKIILLPDKNYLHVKNDWYKVK